MVMLKNKTGTADVVLLNDANNNFSHDQNASNISESSTTAHHSDMDTGKELDYEPEMAEEVTEEVKGPDVRKKRVRRGKGKKKKVQHEAEGVEDGDTVTISRAECIELSQMKTLMRDVVQRLAVVERAVYQ